MYESDARRPKLDVSRDAGVTPFPHNLRVTYTTAEIVGLIGDRSDEALAEDETEVTLPSLMFKNEMGKVLGSACRTDRVACKCSCAKTAFPKACSIRCGRSSTPRPRLGARSDDAYPHG